MAETRNDPDIREKIIAVAINQMTENGVTRTSLNRIAEACGISKGTLYYYYKTKDDLILDINRLNMEGLTSSLLALLAGFRGEEREIHDIILAVFRAVGNAEMRGKMHLYLLNEAVSGNRDLAGKLRESYREWFSIMEKAFIRLLPSHCDREAVARGLVAALDGMVIQNLLGVNDVSMERIVEREVRGYVS